MTYLGLPIITQASPTNPTGTTDGTGVMMGINVTVTPNVTGRFLIIISGSITNSTAGSNSTAMLYTGTGTPPVNGAALTGTQLASNSKVTRFPAGSAVLPFSIQGFISALTIGTTFWMDIALKAAANTATVSNLSVTAMELNNRKLPVFVQSSPVDPTGTTSTTGVMMGIAVSITPKNSGTIMFIVTANIKNSVAADGFVVKGRFGTGTAPNNGDADTGTVFGNTNGSVATRTTGAGDFLFVKTQGIVSGLIPGTAYWIDINLAAITGGTATANNINVTAFEL